jgi:hypothetical protein
MKTDNIDEDILYLEDLEPNIQDAISAYIVSIIENKYRDKAEAVQGSETSTKRQKEKCLPSKKRLPAR